MQQDGLRGLQEERKAREKSHPLRYLQGLLDRHEEALQVQGALSFCFSFLHNFPRASIKLKFCWVPISS